MINYIIAGFIILYLGTISFLELKAKKDISLAIERTREQEQKVCENIIAEANNQSHKKTIKTIIKYEKVKNNVSTLDIDERTALLRQIEEETFSIGD
jgi:hypothetical protein